jgi:hypothetical protein
VVESAVHRNRRLLAGEEDEVAVLLREIAPRTVHVVAEGDDEFIPET